MSVTLMIHSVAALFIIACIALPFVAMSMGKLSREQVAKRAGTIAKLLRIPNFILIVSLVTGLIQSGFYFSGWLLTVVVLFLAIGALLGIATKAVKTIGVQAQQQQDYQASVAKLSKLSIMLAIAIIAMVIIKMI